MPQTLTLNRDDVTLSARLEQAMRDVILDGDLAPGQNLSERALCNMFGVSRSLVREALKTLAAEDLIVHVPHKGPMVTCIDRKQAQDLYRVRAVIEGLACAEFTANATADQCRELAQITDRLAQLIAEEAPEHALVTAKNDFYRCLFSGTQNQPLAKIFIRLNNRVVLLRRRSLTQKGRRPQMLKEIEAIVAAIIRGEGPTARYLAEAHVAAAAQAADDSFADLSNHTNS